MNVLLVDDDKMLSSYMCKILIEADHGVMISTSIDSVIDSKLYEVNDLIILDLWLEKCSGIILLDYLRERGNTIPVFVVSGVVDANVKIDVLQCGADDYMAKPFDPAEFLTHVEALYSRHLESPNTKNHKFGTVIFNWVEAKVMRGEKEILLTSREVKFLKLLVANKGRVVRSIDILNKVWNVGQGYHSNILQSLVRRLRRRVDGGFDRKLIHNVHGVGYYVDLHL